MLRLQKYFIDFNKKIKMDYDSLSELADKRDILLKKLRQDDDLPSFSELNQGSYSMYTGVVPLDKDYDIDVGLRFNVNKDDYDDPVDLKKQIRDILKNHTEYGAKIKQPCVTVSYKKDGELAYHVDLVAYSYEDKDDTSSQMYLARGKEYSSDENKYWEKADPKGLIDKINNKYSGDDREQYRRVIRYMKRWKNIKFSADGNSEPPGIGITLLAYEKFYPSKTYDDLEKKYIYDDLEALINFVNNIKLSFYQEYSDEKKEYLYAIDVKVPVEPYTNVFSKMSLIQMNELKNKIDTLCSELDEVKNESDIVEQCRKLNKIFGDDFDIPEKEQESKKQRNFVPSSSASGCDK